MADLETIEIIQSTLKNLFRFPTSILQVFGLFPFRVKPNNELAFSKFRALYMLFVYLTDVAYIVLALQFQVSQAYPSFFGFTKSELLTNGALTVVGIIAYMLVRISLCQNKRKIEEFHRSIHNLISHVTTEQSDVAIRTTYVFWLKEEAKPVKRICIFIIICTGLEILSIAVGMPVLTIYFSLEVSTLWVIFISAFIALTMAVSNATSLTPIWAVCYVKCMMIMAKILKHESSLTQKELGGAMKEKFKWIIQNIEKLQECIDTFNNLFQEHLIVWLVTIIMLTVQQTFATFVWLRSDMKLVLVHGACIILPYLITNFLALFVLCRTSSKFHENVINMLH